MVGVYREYCQVPLWADRLCRLLGGQGAVLTLQRELIQEAGIISNCFSHGARGWQGGGGKCFPCSWYFPEMKIKTQVTKSNQQAFRRIACTFDFYKNPHKISLTFNYMQGLTAEQEAFISAQISAS